MAKRPSKPVSSRRKPAQPKPKDQATSRHVAKVTLQSVADRRQSMQERVARDRAQRYSAYLQQIEHPAERAGVGVRSLAATAARRRLRILAEGDSWFEYPLPLIGGDGVIVQLERLLGYPILNMAHHGDEVRQMLALQQRREIIARLSDPNIRFDAMLFSGGGNDLVGNQFCLWLKDVQTGVPPEQLLNDERVKAIIGTVEAGYEDLIEIRNRHSPNTALFLHGYDFPKATGIGVCGVGPWLKPSLDFRGIHVPTDQFRVVKEFLTRFGNRLRTLANPTQKIFYVPTQGVLNPDTDWQNEIHPTSTGFKKIANEFKKELEKVFP